ncbi:MAG TPA: DUF2804 domain-containing protein [Myxococcaceae bacterium]|nr:DUF2804 domain-containing protein [Myxococcaceae bacterium]
MLALSPAPAEVPGPDGLPAFGAYAGELGPVNLARLAPPHALPAWARWMRRKRWHYALYTPPEVVAVMAVAEMGYAANAFFAALDLREKQPLVDVTLLGPPAPLSTVSDAMSRGLSASFRVPGARFRFARSTTSDRYRHAVEISPLRLPRSGRVTFDGEALLTGSAPPLALIAPVPGGGSVEHPGTSVLTRDGVNVTQKSVGLLASGRLEVGRRVYSLDGGVVGLDSTHGFLARHTRWRWAMACGRREDGTPLGFNLVAGFNTLADGSAGENALFVGDQIEPVGAATFRFNAADPMDLWRISTDDGKVQVSFRPLHAHRDDRDLGLLRSRFVQPLGVFTGRLCFRGQEMTLSGMPGVTEDQDMLW